MLVDAQASPGLPPSSEQLRTADAYSFRIESNQTITYALEVAGPWPNNISLWQRDAFDQQRQQVSFFHGLLLGIAMLVSIYVSSLFIIRRKLVFPAAALFSWCSAGFLAIEFGYLPVLIDVPVALEYKIRAIVEALMAFSLFACLYTFVELRKRMPLLGYLMLLVIAGSAALVGYAYTEPAMSAGIARMSLLAGSLIGMAVVLALSRRGVIRAQVAVSAWILICVWSILGALGATGIVEHDMIGPGLAAGLVLVNLMIAFTVTQYAFDAGVISSRFFEDSGRRALALAGSEQCVWDWREDQGWLYVGPELEPTLGIKRGSLSTAGLKGWLELMHPGDRPAYVAAVEAAIQRGKGTFSQEFRLRRKDGTYRWYQLRARAIPGEQGRAGRCIGTLADITTLKRSEERMLYDAVQDRLTGLPNRALFMDRLDRALRRSQADDSVKLFVTVVDIDRFKNVNDGLGHSIGDSLLLTMARRLQQFIGPEDTLARLSGDQFGLIINAARPERKMHELTEQVRQAIARPVELNPREVFLTASVGVAEYLRDVLSAADVLKDAEIALYEAKRRGKNKIEFFRPTMRDDRSKLIEIESDLRRALDRNEIEVAYQPIYNIATDKLAGFEALVRWRHKKHGLLGPDEFIGVAEETGIIVDLGRYVMSEAARQLGIWQRVLRPSDPIFVSVNLSSRQVLDQNLVDDVKTIMSREDINRDSLKLELTESLVMENVELSAQVLRKLSDIGVAILCDDFGTGYSSLANLQRFSFDTLKVDKSFVEADPEDDAAMVILESIIILAHDLGMRVVAEGVESKDQLERLRHFECDFAQGFYFGEPLTARAVIEALGGKPHMFEQKRSRTPRGFLGKLMRSGAGDATEQGEPAPDGSDAERQIEELASGRKRSSKLAKLLRRSRLRPCARGPSPRLCRRRGAASSPSPNQGRPRSPEISATPCPGSSRSQSGPGKLKRGPKRNVPGNLRP
jgi:diguanylate cyclase (GGDEF)-like protein/PAS domain S-box-containing protein